MTAMVRLSDAVTLVEVEVFARNDLFGVPVIIHLDVEDETLWRCTEPTTGVCVGRGSTPDAAFSDATSALLHHCPERLSPRGFLNIKLAGVRLKIKYAEKRKTIDLGAQVGVL